MEKIYNNTVLLVAAMLTVYALALFSGTAESQQGDLDVASITVRGGAGLATGSGVNSTVTIGNDSNDTLTINATTTLGASTLSSLTVTGTTALNGNSTIGDASSDTLSLNAVTTVLDDAPVKFGSDSDIQVVYDELTDNRLEVSDGTNLLMHLTDAGTTGNLVVTGTSTSTGATVTADSLTLSNISTDITSGTNEDITINANGTGALILSDAVTASSTLAVTGATTLTGALTANGNVTLGDATTDTITLSGLANSLSVAGATKTAAYTLTATDDVIACETSGGGVTITLPEASTVGQGKMYVISNYGAAGGAVNTCTITKDAADYLNGLNADYTAMDASGDSVILWTNGSDNWFLVGSTIN